MLGNSEANLNNCVKDRHSTWVTEGIYLLKYYKTLLKTLVFANNRTDLGKPFNSCGPFLPAQHLITSQFIFKLQTMSNLVFMTHPIFHTHNAVLTAAYLSIVWGIEQVVGFILELSKKQNKRNSFMIRVGIVRKPYLM